MKNSEDENVDIKTLIMEHANAKAEEDNNLQMFLNNPQWDHDIIMEAQSISTENTR